MIAINGKPYVASEIHEIKLTVFPTAKNLVSWARCCPRNDQSNQKIKSTRISHDGSYFKPVLVQVANALISITRQLQEKHRSVPVISLLYERIRLYYQWYFQ